MPHVALCCMVGTVLWAKEIHFALAIVLSFTAYLRLGELCALIEPQLVEPLLGSGVKWRSLLLAPVEGDKPSKIGTFDEAALLDTDLMLKIAPQLRALKLRAGSGRLWSFSQLVFGKSFGRSPSWQAWQC